MAYGTSKNPGAGDLLGAHKPVGSVPPPLAGHEDRDIKDPSGVASPNDQGETGMTPGHPSFGRGTGN